MLRKMVMMRMLIGNMRRPLSMPTMISCHVICSDPGREGRKQTTAKSIRSTWHVVIFIVLYVYVYTCMCISLNKDQEDFMGTTDGEKRLDAEMF